MTDLSEHWNNAAIDYLEILVGMFGQRDGHFNFRDVRVAPPNRDFPHPFYEPITERDFFADIRISKRASHCLCIAKWEIAHECVHLIDPVNDGLASFLEEGLAHWFQMQSIYHDLDVQKYLAHCFGNFEPSNGHIQAISWIEECGPCNLIKAVRELRCSGTKISSIMYEDLRPKIPHVPNQTIRNLCCTFHKGGIPTRDAC